MEDLVEKNLAEILFQNDYVQIGYNKAIAMLVLSWQRQINFAERVSAYQVAYNFMQELAIRNLLVNNDKIFLFTEPEKNWLAATFNEWAKNTVVEKFALVTSDLYINLTDLVDFFDATKQKFGLLNKVAHEFFTDYETAIMWLSEEVNPNLGEEAGNYSRKVNCA